MNSIITNEYANVLRNGINNSSKSISAILERMSSGFRINSAKDDTSSMAISTKMSVSLNGFKIAQNNLQNGVSLLNTAHGALNNASNLLLRLRDLSLKALNDTEGKEEKQALTDEADELTDELGRIQKNTKFNQLNLFNNIKEEEISSNSKQTQQTQASQATQQTQQNLENINPVSTFSLEKNISNVQNTNAVSVQSIDEINTRSVSATSTNTIISGAFDFAKGETREIEVDGVKYTVTNRNTGEASISYKKDTDTGQVTFTGNYFTIKGEAQKAHNLIISGTYNYVYGGDLDDTFATYDSDSVLNFFYGQKGDDTFNIAARDNTYYGGDGNDTFNNYTNISSITAYGGNGDDTFNLGTSTIKAQGTYYGNDGNDTFNIVNGDGLNIYCGDGDDSVILNKGSNNKIYGGGGRIH